MFTSLFPPQTTKFQEAGLCLSVHRLEDTNQTIKLGTFLEYLLPITFLGSEVGEFTWKLFLNFS